MRVTSQSQVCKTQAVEKGNQALACAVGWQNKINQVSERNWHLVTLRDGQVTFSRLRSARHRPPIRNEQKTRSSWVRQGIDSHKRRTSAIVGRSKFGGERDGSTG